MDKENEIDQLFKRGLDDPEIPFNEMDWEKMERKLDAAQKKKRIIPLWLYTGSGIAAALVIFLFWLFSTPAHIDQTITKYHVPAVKPGTKKEIPAESPAALHDSLNISQPDGFGEKLAGNGLNPVAQPGNTVNRPGNAVNAKGNMPSNTVNPIIPGTVPAGSGVNPFVVPSAVEHAQDPNTQNLAGVKENVPNVPGKQSIQVKPVVPAKQGVPLTEEQIIEQKANALANSKDPFERIKPDDVTRSVHKKMEDALTKEHNLILSAMAAPDISSVPSGKSAKVSSNVGMLATYALGSKFSVTSGAVYAKKYYNSAGSYESANYPGTTADWEVKADCNVLDIPLNVNYKLMNKKKLSVSVNTGLSSYFMLKEKYQYVTDRPGQAEQVSNVEIDNQNQHIFGIANVSVSFDHKISDNLSVGVQPFAKLPLTGIGNNDVNLRSTGVSFSLNIGLFPAKKPGKLAASRYSSLR